MILLDTHAWIWYATQPDLLSRPALRAIEGASFLSISAVSCWEFAMLVARARIRCDRSPASWMEHALAEYKIELLPLTPAVAERSTQLGEEFHPDPADRMIVATALIHDAALVTRDTRIRRQLGKRAIW